MNRAQTLFALIALMLSLNSCSPARGFFTSVRLDGDQLFIRYNDNGWSGFSNSMLVANVPSKILRMGLGIWEGEDIDMLFETTGGRQVCNLLSKNPESKLVVYSMNLSECRLQKDETYILFGYDLESRPNSVGMRITAKLDVTDVIVNGNPYPNSKTQHVEKIWDFVVTFLGISPLIVLAFYWKWDYLQNLKRGLFTKIADDNLEQ